MCVTLLIKEGILICAFTILKNFRLCYIFFEDKFSVYLFPVIDQLKILLYPLLDLSLFIGFVLLQFIFLHWSWLLIFNYRILVQFLHRLLNYFLHGLIEYFLIRTLLSMHIHTDHFCWILSHPLIWLIFYDPVMGTRSLTICGHLSILRLVRNEFFWVRVVRKE